MIHSMKLLWMSSFITGVIVFGIDVTGYAVALAMCLFLLLIAGRVCSDGRGRPDMLQIKAQETEGRRQP